MRKLLALVFFSFMAGRACAVDGVFIERGEGNYVDQVRAGLLWKWDRTWMYRDKWLITGAWEVAAGGWRGEMPGDNNQIIGDLGIQPVFHMAPREGDGVMPYFEASILGVHLISRAFAYDTRKFGSAFQFGHFFGFGLNFGENREYALGFRVQHLSNAGLVRPNQGVNFKQIHFAYNF